MLTTTPPLSRRSMAVRKVPGVSRRIRRLKMISTFVGPTEVEVVGDQRFEEPAGVAGGVEDDGAGELDLPHGGLPPVAGVTVGVGEGLRQQRQPALHEDV